MKIIQLFIFVALSFQCSTPQYSQYQTNQTQHAFPQQVFKNLLQSTVSLPDIIYKATAVDEFFISNIVVSFVVDPSQETFTIQDNENIEFSGNKISAIINYNIRVKEQNKFYKSKGQSQIAAEEYTFTIVPQLNNQVLSFQLVNPQPFQFTGLVEGGLLISKNIDQNAIVDILNQGGDALTPVTQMLNYQFQSTFVTLLQQAINKNSKPLDSLAVYDTQFIYKYQDKQLQFISPVLSYKINTQFEEIVTGLQLADHEDCTQSISSPPYDGESGSMKQQQAFSHQFIKSVFNKIVDSEQITTILNHQNWAIPTFGFYISDFYFLITNVLQFGATTQVSGTCNVFRDAETNLEIVSENMGFQGFIATNTYKCSLFEESKNTQIAQFQAPVQLRIELNVNTDTIDVVVQDFKLSKITFDQVGQFQIIDSELVQSRVNDILTNIVQSKVIGSGFPTLTRQVPKVIYNVNSQNTLVIYE